MSSFTYEIDERNLRIKMKEFVIPVTEDAWQKFETFSDNMVSNQRDNRFKNFNFSLNRNVVLPSVFGIIIILFSFLLVNFVSIKNPTKENNPKTETTVVSAVPEPTQPKIEKSVPLVTQKKQEPLTVVNPTIAEVASVAPVLENVTQEPVETATTSKISSDSAAAIANANDEAKAKRKARRRAEAIESQKLLEISPTPVSEEHDSETRPE